MKKKIGQSNCEHEMLLKAIQLEVKNRIDSLTQSHLAQSTELKTKFKLALSRERSKVDAYKEKAIEAHQRCKLLANKLSISDEVASSSHLPLTQDNIRSVPIR